MILLATTFSFYRRRHHCRVCGQIFCDKCCKEYVNGALIGYPPNINLRVCNYCHQIVCSLQRDENNSQNSNQEHLSDNRPYRTVPRETRSGRLPHVATLNELFTNPAYNSTQRRMSAAEQSTIQCADYCVNTTSFRHSASSSSPHLIFKRKSSLPVRGEDGDDRSIDAIDTPNSPDRFSPRMDMVYSLASTPKSHGINISTNAFHQPNSLVPYEESSSHEPPWVKQIETSKSASSWSQKFVSTDTSEVEKRGVFGRSNKSRHNRQGTFSSTFDIDIDFENVQVVAFKPSKSDENYSSSFEVIGENDLAYDDKDDNEEEDEFEIENCRFESGQLAVSDDIDKCFADENLGMLFKRLSRNLLTQLLKEEKVPLTWIVPLQHIADVVASSVIPENQESISDIRNYVKIKRIVGGSKSDSLIINGLAFTKNIAHRKMHSSINSPKILLLSCPIVYQRGEQKLTSLESLWLQEQSYLKNIMAKIHSYQPDIVVVDKIVARNAQEILLELGITLVYNVKTRILEELARFSGGDIVTSLDAQIQPPSLGVCKAFYTKTFSNSKTLMFFESNTPSLGCTIVLRGSSSHSELEKVKDICYFMIFCHYNWLLEHSLLSDLVTQAPAEEVENCIDEEKMNKQPLALTPHSLSKSEAMIQPVTIHDGSDPLQSMAAEGLSISTGMLSPILKEEKSTSALNLLDFNLSTKLMAYLTDAILSCSPLMSFDLPYFLSKECEESPLRQFIGFDKIYWSDRLVKNCEDQESIAIELETLADLQESTPEVEIELNPSKKHPFVTRNLRSTLNSPSTKDLLADFRACGSVLSKKKCIKSDKIEHDEEATIFIDALDPRYHQRLPVLYCSYSLTVSTTFCINPEISMIEYYGDIDMTLGAFLLQYCFSSTYLCKNQTCNNSVIDHIRKFVHNQGSVQVSLRGLKTPFQSAIDDILTWSWCPHCRSSGPLSILSEKASRLSFGKFLELKLYGKKYRRRGFEKYPPCLEHSLFLDQYQFFVHKNILACFKYEPVEIHAIALPPPKLQIVSTDNNYSDESNPSFSPKDPMKLTKEKIFINLNEEDSGSIIAYAMLTPEYDKQLSEILRGTASPSMTKKFLTSIESSASSFLSSSNQMAGDSQCEASIASSNTKSGLQANNINVQFSSGNTKYYCVVYCAEHFKRIRSELIAKNSENNSSNTSSILNFSSPNSTKLSNLSSSLNSSAEETYIRSISSCVPWTAMGGKSGATFCKTSDDRFILKGMSHLELQSFLKIAKFYFDHVLSAVNEQRPTLLAKIFGVYKIGYKNNSSNSASKLYLLVMENLFYQRIIKTKFDLKGSDRNRLASTENEPDDVVLLDENLVRLLRKSPMYIRHHSKNILSAAIHNDSLFLTSHSVMDYSLLVGIDDEKKEFVVGIIDYIRPYTWDKIIENVVKSVGGHGKMPTVVSPNIYRERFCDKMSQYFLCVPDRWYGFETVDKNQ